MLSRVTGRPDERSVCHIYPKTVIWAGGFVFFHQNYIFLLPVSPTASNFTCKWATKPTQADEILGMSRPSSRGDEMKISSGASQSQVGDELFEIVQYYLIVHQLWQDQMVPIQPKSYLVMHKSHCAWAELATKAMHYENVNCKCLFFDIHTTSQDYYLNFHFYRASRNTSSVQFKVICDP
jgi:hypothetical protein